MRHEKISIKWKIFTCMLVFTGILLVVLWLVQICYLDTFYKIIKEKEAKALTGDIVSVLKSGSKNVEEQIDVLAAQNNMTVFVADAYGTMKYSAEYIATSRLKTMPAELVREYYEEAKASGGTVKIEFEGGSNKTFPAEIQPDSAAENGGAPAVPPPEGLVQNHGQGRTESVIYVNLVQLDDEELVLMVNAQLTPVDATVHTLRAELLWITVILVVLSLGVALLLSRQVSKSLIHMNESAKEMAKGNFAIRFEGKDYKEVAELSDTLNLAAEELNKSELLRRELLANVSHDLRTPLTMITAYAEVMRDLPGENTPENVQVVIEEAERLTNLVNDMLDISKLEAGVMELQISVYNLTESIRSVFARYNKLKEQDGYTISFSFEREVYVEADEYKIFQVIYNLVNNGINYTGEDKKVCVRQKALADGYVRIEVSDSGSGIAAGDLPYVWDRYYKVDKNHRRAVMGTGLGLSIVKNILALHHARYGVESTEGEGAVFWFELKMAAPSDIN